MGSAALSARLPISHPLPVWMNVSLSPWLSEFHAVCSSGSSCCLLFLNWLLSFFWLCDEVKCFYLHFHFDSNLRITHFFILNNKLLVLLSFSVVFLCFLWHWFSPWSLLFPFFCFLWVYCALLFLVSWGENGSHWSEFWILKSLPIIAGLSVSPCNSISFCFVYFESLLLDTYTFR